MTFRPALRPGALLLRRDATHLQIGTSPGVVIGDRPGLLALLRLFDGSRDVERLQGVADERLPELTVPVHRLLPELRGLGIVFDASRWSGPRRRGLDAEARHVDVGGGDPCHLVARSSFRLTFRSDHTSRPVAEIADRILGEAGVRSVEADPHLLVVVSCGEAPRSEFEQATLADTDHLPVVVDEDHVRIGPLVRPGLTPCVSCHDLHRSDWDPAWPALLHQIARRPSVVTPPALDALTTHAAGLELATEILAHVDGGLTRTLGQCLVIGPEPATRATWPLTFHHACVCDLLNAA